MSGLNVDCLNDVDRLCQENLSMYLKVFLLLYADDTVIFSKTAKGLQNALNMFEKYCELWKLTVNISKTKIVVFMKRKGQVKQDFLFKK